MIAGSKLFHRAGHLRHRTDDETAEEGREEDDHHADRKDRGNGGCDAELVDRRIGGIGVDDEADIPFDRGKALHRNEAHQHRLAAEFGVHDARTDRRRVDREGLGERFGDELGIRMHEDLAVLAGEEGKAFAADVDALDHRYQRIERKVAGGNAIELAVTLDRHRRTDDERTGRCVDIGLGQNASVGLDGLLVPRTLARVVAGRHRIVRPGDELAALVADIGRHEFAGQHVVLQDWLDGAVIGRAAGGIGDHRGQRDAAVQPLGNALRGLRAGGGNVLLDGLGGGTTLQRVDVNGKAGKGADDDTGRGDEDARHEVRSLGQDGLPMDAGDCRRT